MPNQAIISFAVLKAIADTSHTDFLENFVPFVAECIRVSDTPIVSTTVIQNQLKQQFGGLCIPQPAIDKILERLKQRGFLILVGGAYVRVGQKLKQLTFEAERARFIHMHDTLVTGLTTYANTKFRRGWSASEAEAALQAFLNDGELLSFVGVAEQSPAPDAQPADPSERFITGSFVQDLFATDPATFGFLESVFMGCMLAQAIFLPDPNPRMQGFQDTEIYFDTSLLMWAIDCAGPARRDPCTELLEMLHRTGAQLRCFRHTLGEIRGALDNCAKLLRDDRDLEASGPAAETLRYFRSQGMFYGDILVKIGQLEEELEGLKIRVVDTPAYGLEEVYQWVIDEAKLAETVSSQITYSRPASLERDVKSMAAIMMLRKGHTAFDIERCSALFVTSNWPLVKATAEFFRQEHDLVPGAIPPCLDERVLSTYVWLNMPLQAPPDLPRKRIIADCYAATQPSETLWRRFVSELRASEQRGEISPETCYLLRNSQVGTTALMESTLGDEAAFTRGTIEEIMQQAKAEMSEDVRRQLEEERLQMASEQVQRRRAETERDSALEIAQAREVSLQEEQSARREAERRLQEQKDLQRDQIASVRANIEYEAQRIARRRMWVIGSALVVLFTLGDSGLAVALPFSALGKGVAFVFALALVAATLLNALPRVWNKSIADWMREQEAHLAQRIQRELLARYGLSDSEMGEVDASVQ